VQSKVLYSLFQFFVYYAKLPYIRYTLVTAILLYTGILQRTGYYIMAKTAKTNLKTAQHTECNQYVLPVRDTLDILSGKWKLPIIGALIMGKKRFKEMERQIPKITARMLSKELKELEVNQLVKRTVYDTTPVTVEYELTTYGASLKEVIMVLANWGVKHRSRILGKKKELPPPVASPSKQ
jgi:DNA-binding HxlR family transcriptional regulator